jgi:hypothetical protein
VLRIAISWRHYEDEVARMLETTRAKEKLPPLARIVHRESLEQLVCRAATLDAPVWKQNSAGALMYRTENPASLSEDLENIARFKELPQKDQPTLTRYAVAVWPLPTQQLGRQLTGSGYSYT